MIEFIAQGEELKDMTITLPVGTAITVRDCTVQAVYFEFV